VLSRAGFLISGSRGLTRWPPFCEVRSVTILEDHRRLRLFTQGADHRPGEDALSMLLAPGVTRNGGLAAEEFHLLPTLAQRPAAAVRAQIAEPDLLGILVPHCESVLRGEPT
jgi:hypothetical protein